MKSLLLRPCGDDDELHAWVRLFTGLNVPRKALCSGHDAPFDYLRYSYFEPASDLVVWAPRGGGKTRLAAVATLLDLLHKPPASVRILGGSLEQSLKMWEYLLPDLQRLAGDELGPRVRESSRRIRLRTGASAAVLTQSQRAVRGLRIQKLRCDEVELFDPRIWGAAQLTTRSIRAGRAPALRCFPSPTLPFSPSSATIAGAVDATHFRRVDEPHRGAGAVKRHARPALVPAGRACAMRAGAKLRRLPAVGGMPRAGQDRVRRLHHDRRCDSRQGAGEPPDVADGNALPPSEHARARVSRL